MSAMASQIPSLTIVYSTVYSGTDDRNIKAPRHWPLWGEFAGDRWIPEQRASEAENVSIWLRYHVVDMNKACNISPSSSATDTENNHDIDVENELSCPPRAINTAFQHPPFVIWHA